MKAQLNKNGTITIKAETIAEAFALRFLTPLGEEHICDKCRQHKSNNIIIDANVPESDTNE